MKNNTLFFIPDISGFTRFVSNTEISHGQHIISELLEILIDANELELTLGEIEGDAILFYKTGSLPDSNLVAKQAESMFTRFHQHLKKYEGHRICECGACRGAGNLSLKIIAHTGYSDFINVKGQQKPYGPDVILAHRLLKNNIKSKEYLLFSHRNMKDDFSDLSVVNFPWLDLKQGSTEYESIGKVDYYFSSLSDLHKSVPEPETDTALKSSRPIVMETFIDKSRDEVFEIIIDLNQRMRWNKFAKSIDYDPNQLNQTGTKHLCVFDTHTIEFESVKADFGMRNLVYGEKILDLPSFAKDITIYFIVGPENNGCRVQLQVHYVLKPLIGWLLGPIFRKKNISIYTQVLQHLKEYCELKTVV